MPLSLLLPLLTPCPQDVIHRFDGSTDLELFGRGLASIEDFDRDGYPDLLIGVSRADDLAIDAGRVEIRSSANGRILKTFPGAVVDGMLGYSVASCGDLDGDGVPDVIAGAVNDSIGGLGSGAVFAFSGARGNRLWVATGLAGQREGYAMASIADVNADGVADLLVGAPAAVHRGVMGGQARVLSGATGDELRVHTGTVEEMEMGHFVSALSDLDSDGVSDYAVGAHYDDTGHPRAGAVFVYSGATGKLIRTFRGAYPKGYFGNSIAGTNDLDGDGVGEIIIGAPGGLFFGKVFVYSGATGSQLFLFESDNQGEVFGNRVAAADVNGDDLDDFVIAARLANDEQGRVAVYSGADGSMLAQMRGRDRGSRFGQGLVAIGDTNGDGSDEWMAWAAEESALAKKAGQVTLHSGSPLHTTRIDQLIAGSTTTAVVGGCEPGAVVLLAWSLQGAGPTESEWGLVSLSMPLTQLPSAVADSRGEASWSAPIPAGIEGTPVWLQGLDLTAGVLSQPLSAIVQ